MNPRIRHLLLALPGLLGGAGMAVLMAARARTPTGDAPGLQATALRLAGELASHPADGLRHLLTQATPHPPLGTGLLALLQLALPPRLAPLVAGVLALGAVSWAAHRIAGAHRPALLATLLLLATPLTWCAVELLQWDLLAAGAVALGLGAAASMPRRPLLAGLLLGGAVLVKYSAALFLWAPALLLLGQAIRDRRRGDALRFAAGCALPLALWLPLVAPDLGTYLGASLADGATDSASHIPPLADRLLPRHLAYYPAVLVQAVGWPGLLLCALAPGALRREPGGLAAAAGLGGLLALTLIGRREARYLLPALPFLLLAGATVLARWRVGRLGLGALVVAGVVQLGCSAATWRADGPLQSLRGGTFELADLGRWGSWPRPAPAFVPTDVDESHWKVSVAVDALLAEPAEGAVAFVLPEPAPFPAELVALRATERGARWDVLELRQRRGPAATGFALHRGPWADAAETAPLLLAVHDRRDPRVPDLLDGLQATPVSHWALPGGLKAGVWRVPDAGWASPTGRALRGR